MELTKENTDYLPARLFNKIMKCLPIVSAEALISTDEGLLLLKRNNKPVKGEWWFPGGRIRKGESPEEALRREVKEETNLDLDDCKLINVYSRIFPERHDITVAYFCKTKPGKIVLNREHSKYAFFKRLPHDLHPCIHEVLTDTGWKTSS
jgi:ADP-ribose pyrophosphatase YjhB (NUDIX family)